MHTPSYSNSTSLVHNPVKSLRSAVSCVYFNRGCLQTNEQTNKQTNTQTNTLHYEHPPRAASLSREQRHRGKKKGVRNTRERANAKERNEGTPTRRLYIIHPSPRCAYARDNATVVKRLRGFVTFVSPNKPPPLRETPA